MAGKLHDYLIYGGTSREEFRRVLPRLHVENQKIWRITSILLAAVASSGVLYNLLLTNMETENLVSVIIYAALALFYVIIAILLFTAVSPSKIKAVSWTVYVAGGVGIVAAYSYSCYAGGFSIVLCFSLALGGFLYLDRPIKNFILLSSGMPVYIGFSIARNGMRYLFPTLIIWILGLIISSYTNYRRICNHITMIRFERLGNTDSLTGVFNKNKYDDTVKKLQTELDVRDVEFAVVVFDVNRLKETNDTYGHNRGDELLIRSVELIKEVFQRSDVYRIGGDEFCCILTGEDYEHRAYLVNNFHNKVITAHEMATSLQRDTSVACGLATFDPGADTDYTMVFSRADKNMYRNKAKLKADNKFGKKEPSDDEVDEEMGY